MFRLPIYKRGNTYTLHTRINGKQVKVSLRTHDRWEAACRAIELLNIMKFDKAPPLPRGFEHLSKSPIKPYELDLARNIFKAEGPEDHERLMEAMRLAEKIKAAAPPPPPPPPPPPAPPSPVVIVQESAVKGGRFTILKLFENYSSVKALKASSLKEFEISAREFNKHVNSRQLYLITDTDISTFITKLRTNGNGESTVDKKVGNIRTMVNFAIKQKTFKGENVASEKNLQTKQQKENRGQKAQAINDLVEIYNRPEYRECRTTQPAYFYINTLAIITGMRISSIARLTAIDLKVSIDKIPYIDIDDDKSPSGRRDVCIPLEFHEKVKDYLSKNSTFGLTERVASGKGYSDPVRKMHLAYLQRIKYTQKVFTAHAYRKTFNEYLIEEEVGLEIRCQLLGHAINHVNVAVYGKKKIPMKKVAEKVVPLQEKILNHLGLGS